MGKKHKVRGEFLGELKKVPIVQVACERVGVSRNSVYRWKREDKDFKEDMEQALAEGEALVNDMSESQLLTLIKEKNWSAISFLLRHRNPKFKDKVEVTTKFEDNDELSPSQSAIVRKALQLAEILPAIEKNHDQEQNYSAGTRGENAQGQESESSDN